MCFIDNIYDDSGSRMKNSHLSNLSYGSISSVSNHYMTRDQFKEIFIIALRQSWIKRWVHANSILNNGYLHLKVAVFTLTHCFSFCTFLLVIIWMFDFDVGLQVTFPLDGHATHGTRHPQVSSSVLQHVLCQHLPPGEGAWAQVTHIWPKVG